MKNSLENEYLFVEYFYYKYVKAIACSKDPTEVINFVFDNFNITDDIVSLMITFIRYFAISYSNCMDKKMKDNLFTFISFLKIDSDNIDTLNDLIVVINNCNDSKMLAMVHSEYRKRFASNKVANEAILNMDVSTRLLKNMNIRDFNILITHSKVYDDETFSDVSEIYSTDALEYMASINMIVRECPAALSDDLFFKRVHIIRDMMYPKISDKKVIKVYNKFRKNIK